MIGRSRKESRPVSKSTDTLVVSRNKLQIETVTQLLRSLNMWGVQTTTDTLDAWRRLVHGDVKTLIVCEDLAGPSGPDFIRWVRHDTRLQSRKAHILLICNDPKTIVAKVKTSGANQGAAFPLSIADFLQTHAELKADDRPFVEVKSYAGPCRRVKPSAGRAIPRRRLADRSALMAALGDLFTGQIEALGVHAREATVRTRADLAATQRAERDALFAAAMDLVRTTQEMEDDPLILATRALSEALSGPGVVTEKVCGMIEEFAKATMHLFVLPLEMERERDVLAEHIGALAGRIGVLRRKVLASAARV